MKRYELERILKEGVLDIYGKKIIVWGTGNTSLLYQEGFKRLEKEGTLTITGYCDSNPKKWGGGIL